MQLAFDFEAHEAQPEALDVLSYGGGLDSWTMLHKSVELGEKPDLVIFADVGDDKDRSVPGEWPSTLRHIDEVAKPFAAKHGIPWVTLTADYYPLTRGGRTFRSLFEYGCHHRMFFAATQHLCTIAGKIDRIAAYLDDHYSDREVRVWIGFTAGEEARMRRDPRGPEKMAKLKDKPGKARRRSRYPLCEWGMCRCREEAYCRKLPYPVPRKSACVYCNRGSRKDFLTLLQELPEQFARVEHYERNAKLTSNGRKLKMGGTDDECGYLRDYVHGRKPDGGQMREFKYKKIPCEVCGAERQATKATGCDYLAAGRGCAA